MQPWRTQCISSSPDDRHSGSGRKVRDPPHLHPALPQNSLCPLTGTFSGTAFLHVSSVRRTWCISALSIAGWTPLSRSFRTTKWMIRLFVYYWNNYQSVPKHFACSLWSKLSKWRRKGEETACWNTQTSFGVRRAVNCNRQWKWCIIKHARLPCILFVRT
jgi:hypothetical protein